MHASRQVAIVPVFRRSMARTPHCCLPKHTAGSPRIPSSLARSPTPFAQGKRNARRPSLHWWQQRHADKCHVIGPIVRRRANLSGSPVISLPVEAPPEKAIPGVSFLSLHESARVAARSDRLKGLRRCACMHACVRDFFFYGPTTIQGDRCSPYSSRMSFDRSLLREEGPRTSFRNVVRGRKLGSVDPIQLHLWFVPSTSLVPDVAGPLSASSY